MIGPELYKKGFLGEIVRKYMKGCAAAMPG